MDNDIAGILQVLQKSGHPARAIRAHLEGKEGCLRGKLMCKRVDFSPRAVITRNPNLELDEVGAPAYPAAARQGPRGRGGLL